MPSFPYWSFSRLVIIVMSKYVPFFPLNIFSLMIFVTSIFPMMIIVFVIKFPAKTFWKNASSCLSIPFLHSQEPTTFF